MPFPTDGLISSDVELALERIRNGGLVAIPTETVYGLAADAEQPDAVARIYTIKGRPVHHPLIVHVAGVEFVDGWVGEFSESAGRLATVCWPGPLTMLLPRGPRCPIEVTGGRSTVGIRVPSHPLTLDLLARLGGGLAAPSANRFGKVSPTTAQHVQHDLAGLLEPGRDLILDGGACEIGVESTIVDLTVDPPQVLRAGAISAEQIGRLLSIPTAPASGPSRTSGMMLSHYAPDCRVLLVDDGVEAEAIAAILRSRGERVGVLDRSDDLVLAAQLLYSDLRAADEGHLDALVVVMPPPRGIGHAVRDRLTKAASRGGPAPDEPNPVG
jgi:L-threonylcarbamoyladenylate synthase